LSDEAHRLRATYRSDRHDASYRNFRRDLARAGAYTWRLRARHLQGLSATARRFLRRATQGVIYRTEGGRLLVACARALDRIAELEAAVQREGAQVAGSRGRLRTNPRLRELRRLERALKRALGRLGLSPDGNLSRTEKPAGLAV